MPRSLLDLLGRAAMDRRPDPARRIALFGALFGLLIAVLVALPLAALVIVAVVLGPDLAVVLGPAGWVALAGVATAAREWLRRHAGR
jgi:hypothetical protein